MVKRHVHAVFGDLGRGMQQSGSHATRCGATNRHASTVRCARCPLQLSAPGVGAGWVTGGAISGMAPIGSPLQSGVVGSNLCGARARYGGQEAAVCALTCVGNAGSTMRGPSWHGGLS